MQSPIPAEVLSDLIGDIYDCALDPQRWEATLARIQKLANCANAAFAVHSVPAGRMLLTVTNGIDAAHLARLDDYGADMIEQWGGVEAMARHGLDEPAVLSWLRPRELWENNRYFAEWAKPQGICDVLGFMVARDATAHGTVGLGRHRSAGPVTRHDVDLLRLILPHFQRAVSISRILDIRTIAARTFEATLDAVPAAIILVDAELRIVHANEAADALLAKGHPISSERGILRVRLRAAQQALADTVAKAGIDEALIGRRGFGIAASHADGDPAVLHVLPLRRGDLRLSLKPAATAAIFVAPATLPVAAPEQALAALYDLTPAEAKVFSLLASGMPLATIAARLGIRHSTARTHLQRLFAKTGAGRQAELIRLAASLAMFA